MDFNLLTPVTTDRVEYHSDVSARQQASDFQLLCEKAEKLPQH